METDPIWYGRKRERLNWEALVLLLLQCGYLISGSKECLWISLKTMDQRWRDWKVEECGGATLPHLYGYRCCLGWGEEGMITRTRGRWAKTKRGDKSEKTGASMRCSVCMALLCLHYLKALINLSPEHTKSIVNAETQKHFRVHHRSLRRPQDHGEISVQRGVKLIQERWKKIKKRTAVHRSRITCLASIWPETRRVR